MFGSSRPEVFGKKGVLRNFKKFTGKHLCQCLFFNKVASLRPATLSTKRLCHKFFPVSCEFLKISKKTCFYRTPPVAASKCCWPTVAKEDAFDHSFRILTFQNNPVQQKHPVASTYKIVGKHLWPKQENNRDRVLLLQLYQKLALLQVFYSALYEFFKNLFSENLQPTCSFGLLL